MNALFALADAGCSSFDTGGAGWPPCPGQAPLTELLAGFYGNPAAASAWLYGGAERVLGVFKRRWVWSGVQQAAYSQCYFHAGTASNIPVRRCMLGMYVVRTPAWVGGSAATRRQLLQLTVLWGQFDMIYLQQQMQAAVCYSP
jgi:hypothetical protein